LKNGTESVRREVVASVGVQLEVGAGLTASFIHVENQMDLLNMAESPAKKE
jgi:hypothetical protein